MENISVSAFSRTQGWKASSMMRKAMAEMMGMSCVNAKAIHKKHLPA